MNKIVNFGPKRSTADDTELNELAQMEAQEQAAASSANNGLLQIPSIQPSIQQRGVNRPAGHSKVFTSGYLVGNNGNGSATVQRGAKVPGLHGVGQPTIDGFISANNLDRVRQAAAYEVFKNILYDYATSNLLGTE